MNLAEVQAKLKASIWQSVAQSGVDVSSLPQAEMDKLVGAITTGVLKAVDDLLSQASGRPASTPAARVEVDEDEEVVLWEGRPFLSLTRHYQITSERVRITEGLLGKQREDIELVRIQDVDHKQTLTERMLNLGDVYIRSHDPSHPQVVLNNVADPLEVHETLRRAVLKARQRHNLSYREEM
ncbi:MAG: PH domain-containing protein [Chloroflexota bacterium]